MAGDVFLLDPQSSSDSILHALRALRARPDVHFPVAKFRQRRRRLHRRVRQQRRVIFRFDDLAALSKLRVHIADVAENLPRFPRRCL